MTSAFADPTEFSKDETAKSQSKRFKAEWPNKSWAHQVAGGENVVVLVFVADQPVSKAEAKQLADWVKNQRPELIQGGAMLSTTLPDAAEFPDGKDMHLKATFELLDVTHPVEPPA